MIDIEVRKAFDVEMICILLANKMAMVKRGRVTINSNCQAALDAAPRDYSAGFSDLINNWTLGDDVTLNEIMAHPERYKHHTKWDWNDKGI